MELQKERTNHRPLRRGLILASLMLTAGAPAVMAHAAARPGASESAKQAAPNPNSPAPAQGQQAQPGPQRSGNTDAAVQHLPSNCGSVAFFDVGALASTEPVQANRDLLRQRATMLIDRYPQLSQNLKQAGQVLQSSGIDWRHDIDAIGACFDQGRFRLLTVEGPFEGKNLIGALASASAQAGRGPVTVSQHNGLTMADMNGSYAAQVSPNVLVVATTTDDLDAANATGPGLAQRGGATNDLAFFTQQRPNDQTLTSTFTRSGDKSFAVDTLLKQPEPFAADQARRQARSYVDNLTSKLRNSPLSALADSVSRTQITVHGSELHTRTILPSDQVRRAIASAATSTADEWRIILPQVESLRPGVGGGPSGTEQQNQGGTEQQNQGGTEQQNQGGAGPQNQQNQGGAEQQK